MIKLKHFVATFEPTYPSIIFLALSIKLWEDFLFLEDEEGGKNNAYYAYIDLSDADPGTRLIEGE